MVLVGDDQVSRIERFEQEQSPVHYLLHNPATIPWSQGHPLTPGHKPADVVDVGCRVVPAADLRSILAGLPAGASPTYGMLVGQLPSPFLRRPNRAGRRLEDFMVRLVTCKEGYRATGRYDDTLGYVFNRRGAPIVAAIGITIAGPDEHAQPTGTSRTDVRQ